MSIAINSYLTSVLSASVGSGDPVLSALYGAGSKASGSSGQTPVAALLSAQRNQPREVAMTAAEPTVKHTIASFTQAVTDAKSVKQLLADPTVMNVLLTANGMKDQIGYTALATQALTSDLNDPNSLVNRLSDSRWKTLAQTYNFAANGLATIQKPATIASISKAYATASWALTEDSVTPGLSTALGFISQAPTVKSVDGVLGNPTVRAVVTGALGIPQQIAFQPLEAQEKAVASRLDVTRLQDPKFVQSLAEQYLINNAQNAKTSTTPDLTSLAVSGRGIWA
jgi:hypothetical protein